MMGNSRISRSFEMTRPFSLAALAVVSALVLAACGGSSYGGSSSPSTSTSATSGAASATPVVTAKSSSLGTFLTDAKGRTLYLWDADHGSKSACNGDCAEDWPPLTTKGAPKAGAGVKASLLGTTKRADGTQEVTYAGHPLYYYAGDTAAGQTTGQGSSAFGAPWWVVTPAGKALTS
jgi:predicted lipoprotein with Yx(FWY)xxD motif